MDDFLKEIKYLGITARIKRLNDALSYNIKDLYRSQNLDIEPSWHLILLLLKKNKQLSLVELSKQMQISQPAVTKIIKKMLDKGYVKQSISSTDNRVKIIELTRKSHTAFPIWEKVWDAGQQAIANMLADNEAFFTALAEFEKQQVEDPFSDRAKKFLADGK